MKLLLTSFGLSNKSILQSLIELIGKQPSESKIAFVPSGGNPSRGDKSWMIGHINKFIEAGYYVDLIELTAMDSDAIKSAFENVDAIVFGGGNCFYLSYWSKKKGIFEFLPEILKSKVFVGISAGSMLAGKNFNLSSQALAREELISAYDYNNLGPANESLGETLGLVDFVFKPHLNSAESANLRTEDYVRSVAHRGNGKIYAADDNSAIKIVDGNIEIITEGSWLELN
jgi:dipeptidase E